MSAGRPRRRSAPDRELAWQPALDTPVGSYVMRLTIEENGKRRIYGGRRPVTPERASAPVVRVLGIEAAFTQRSYLPEERMALRVLADAPAFTLTFLRVGHGPDPSFRSDELVGLEMGDPVSIDWTGKSSSPRTIVVQSGDWPSGLYAARLETLDGRVGFAPFVLRATAPGPTRVAVVLPTNTWQAYNLYDTDGDGWGDTWYAGGLPPVALDRPYRDRGVPPRFRRYDFPFLRWLEKTRRDPDFLTDDDLDTIPSGDELRRVYDLVVFPGTRNTSPRRPTTSSSATGTWVAGSSSFRPTTSSGRSSGAARRSGESPSGGISRGQRRACSGSSTGRTTTGSVRRRSSSRIAMPRPGCSRAPTSRTATGSARRSAGSGSRST